MLQKKYVSSQEGSIASYNYTDIAEGTGVVTYYGAYVSGAYLLTTNSTIYSEKVLTESVTCNSGSWQLCLSKDFDVEFNLPRTIKGKAYVNIPFGIVAVTATEHYYGYCVAKVKKYSGITETTLVSYQGNNTRDSTGAAGSQDYYMEALPLEVPLTHFKKGDKLRLTIELWGQNVPTGGSYRMLLAHDPKNRAYGWWDQIAGGAGYNYDMGSNPSILNFSVPFRVDI